MIAVLRQGEHLPVILKVIECGKQEEGGPGEELLSATAASDIIISVAKNDVESRVRGLASGSSCHV